MNRPSDIRGHFSVYYGSQLIGETSALSSKQAINNVRHKVMGETMSQYNDPAMWSAKEKQEVTNNVKDTGI